MPHQPAAISEAELRELAEGWLSVAGHVVQGAKTKAEFIDQFEGVLQNAMRQAAQIGYQNANR